MKSFFFRFFVFFLIFVYFFNVVYYEYAEAVTLSTAALVGFIAVALVAGGIVVYNNVDDVIPFAKRLWDELSESARRNVEMLLGLGTSYVTLGPSIWQEIIDKSNIFKDESFTITVKDAVSSDALEINALYIAQNGVSKGSPGYYEYKIPLDFGYDWKVVGVVTDTKFYEIVYSASEKRARYFEVVDGVRRQKEGFSFPSAITGVWVETHNDGKVTRIRVDKPSGGWEIPFIIMTKVLVDGVLFKEKQYDYAPGELDVNTNKSVSDLSDVKVSVPSSDVNTYEKLEEYLSKYVGVNQNIYENLFEKENSLSNTVTNIMTGLNTLVKVLTTGLVGDISQVNVQPLVSVGSVVTTKFPFSLPFDIYNCISGIGSNNDLPALNFGFYDPVSKRVISNYIDLDDEYPVIMQIAPFVRAGLLLAFTISLVYGTRRLLGGAE